MMGAFSIFLSSRSCWNTGVSRMPRRIHRPTPTRTIESANGIRQPQVTNWSPVHWLNARTARFDRNRPHGTPNCGQEATRPALAVGARPLHRQQHRSAPFAADADALKHPQHRQDDRAPDADRRVGRHERDQEGRDAHAQQRGDQRRLAADAVTVVAEYRGADRAADEADEIGAEGGERRRQRILVGKVELAEDKPGGGAVEEKVVPLDRGTDGRCDDSLAQLRAVIGFG